MFPLPKSLDQNYPRRKKNYIYIYEIKSCYEDVLLINLTEKEKKRDKVKKLTVLAMTAPQPSSKALFMTV
jgi:hypothetical protein